MQFVLASSSLLDTLDAKEDSDDWFTSPLSELNIVKEDLNICIFMKLNYVLGKY